jgi:hypothetical protein
MRLGSKCLCRACGAVFGGLRAFDTHRLGTYRVPGDRRCLSAASMSDAGLVQDERGIWRQLYGRRCCHLRKQTNVLENGLSP